MNTRVRQPFHTDLPHCYQQERLCLLWNKESFCKAAMIFCAVCKEQKGHLQKAEADNAYLQQLFYQIRFGDHLQYQSAYRVDQLGDSSEDVSLSLAYYQVHIRSIEQHSRPFSDGSKKFLFDFNLEILDFERSCVEAD